MVGSVSRQDQPPLTPGASSASQRSRKFKLDELVQNQVLELSSPVFWRPDAPSLLEAWAGDAAV